MSVPNPSVFPCCLFCFLRQARDFFKSVLGFRELRRPTQFEDSFQGAWLCGLSVEM